MSNWAQLSRGIVYDYDTGAIRGDLRIGDLAHALAGINRFYAWPGIYWSVASHACLVSGIIAATADCDFAVALRGLHHDDHEAIVGDVLSPQKWSWSDSMRQEWEYHARRAQSAVLRALGIWQINHETGASSATVVHMADMAALEAERLWLFSPKMEWATEKLVNPKMLEAGQRILAGDFSRITGGSGAAERFCTYHNGLLQKLGRA